MCPEQNFDFSSFISPSVFLFSTSVNTQPAKTKPHILPRLLPSSWSSCFCSSIQNSPKPSHLKITSKSRTRPMTGPPTHLSVTSSPPTSSLLTTLLPRCLHAARPTRRACFHPCPCLLFLEHPSPRYQSAWPTSSLFAHISPHQRGHPNILPKTSQTCHSSSPPLCCPSLSLPDPCCLTLLISVH